MPNGTYLTPVLPRRVRKRAASQPGAPGPGLLLRLRTWWRRELLDEQLAEGTDPKASYDLTLRAEQLSSRAERVGLADALEDLVSEAREQATISHLLLRRRRVRACSDELLALARRLRDDQPIDLRGAAMTALLLSDGSGPLYYERASVPLRQALRSARLVLEPAGQDAGSAFPSAA